MRGRLTAYVGPMFSGKTTKLIQKYDELLLEKRTCLFKPTTDGRYGVNNVGSHSGEKRSAISVYSSNHLSSLVNSLKPSAICVDEIQFLDYNIISGIDNILDDNVDVYFSGLNQDYTGKAFRFRNSTRNIGELVMMADDVELLKSVCEDCGVAASKTVRKHRMSGDVVVGGKTLYSPTCNKHFYVVE